MPDFLLRIANLCRKELLAILKDPASRVVLFGPAILQTLIFGYAATFDLGNVPYALVDQSKSVASAALVARLDGTGVCHRVAGLQTPAPGGPGTFGLSDAPELAGQQIEAAIGGERGQAPAQIGGTAFARQADAGHGEHEQVRNRHCAQQAAGMAGQQLGRTVGHAGPFAEPLPRCAHGLGRVAARRFAAVHDELVQRRRVVRHHRDFRCIRSHLGSSLTTND